MLPAEGTNERVQAEPAFYSRTQVEAYVEAAEAERVALDAAIATAQARLSEVEEQRSELMAAPEVEPMIAGIQSELERRRQELTDLEQAIAGVESDLAEADRRAEPPPVPSLALPPEPPLATSVLPSLDGPAAQRFWAPEAAGHAAAMRQTSFDGLLTALLPMTAVLILLVVLLAWIG